MRSWRLAIVITLLVCPGLLAAAQVAFEYNTAPRTIRACQLLIPNGGTNANSYVLPMLARCSLKPPGWSFVNPQAPSSITDTIWTLWLNPAHNPDANDRATWRSGNGYWAGRGMNAVSPLRATVPPEWPQYWEVALDDASAEQLIQFDLIYIASAQDLNITSDRQRAGLRRAVENGAVLWVDYAGGNVVGFPVPRPSVAPGTPEPVPYAPFAFGALGGNLTTRTAAAAGHALLSFPYALSGAEIRQLGDYPGGAAPYPAYAVTDLGGNDVTLAPVVVTATGSAAGAGVAAARYGDGAIVVTAEGVGQDIEEWHAGLPGPGSFQRADVKLGYNIANYSHTAGQAAGSPSGRSVEFAPARPPLDLVWQFPPPWGDPTLPSQPGPVPGSAVVSGGNVYVLSTFGPGNRPPTLWCLQPGTFSNGYRLVWSQALPAGYTSRSSSPVMALANSGAGPAPVVLVTAVHAANGVGALLAYDAADGAGLWSLPLGGYVGTASVVDLSSPVAYKNWLFVLSTEMDGGLGAGIQSTYGRVWAINWGWAGPAVSWVYPDLARAEEQKLLPPTHSPAWAADTNRVEFPPEGDVRPAVVTSPRTPLGLPVEAALLVSAPARLTCPAPPTVNTIPGYTEYCLVPTPTNPAGAPLLNSDYYVARLNNTGVTNVDAALRNDSDAESVAVSGASFTFSGTDFARFNNAGGVLEFLATLSSAPQADGYDNPLTLRRGCRVDINYRVGATTYTGETHYLPGPLAWSNETEAFGFHTSEHTGRTLACGLGLSVLDTETGRSQVCWQPRSDSPIDVVTTSEAAPAQEAETAYVASNARTGATQREWTGLIHGVRTQADLAIHLGPALGDEVAIAPGSAVTVTLLATGALVSTANFDVDYAGRTIRFRPSAGATVGGKALTFTWTDSDGNAQTELHVAPKLSRFEYVGGFVRLQRYPVVASTVAVTLTNGMPVAGVVAGEPAPLPTYNLRGAGVEEVLANGWLDFRGATITDNQGFTHPLAGREVLISYTGWSEPDYAPVAVGWADPTPAVTLRVPDAERQQVPVGLGASLGGVGVAGTTAVVGSVGWTPIGGANFDIPPGAENEYQTLVSLVWDPISHLVKGAASRVAFDDPAGPRMVPGVLSTPTSAGGQLYVSSVGMSAPLTMAGPGWVGCLSPRRTVICDGNRLVETTGSDRTWVLTASQAYVYGRSAPEPMLAQPFSRPAKATPLSSGSFLVVDTGNNRVIVVDRAGNQLWPLDEFGLDYYSSPARTDASVPGGVAGNYNLKLAQPADAFRYVDSGGLVHTVIADAAHNRIIDVLTVNLALGGQQHQVVELTPSHVRPAWDPTHRLALRYVRAQPIFDFNNGNVVGYLCAASNVDRVLVVEAGTKYVDPDPATTPPGGTRPWRDWQALYNTDLQNLDDAPVLSFPNLRHVEYFRYGERVYVLVVAGGLIDIKHNVSVKQDGVWVWEIDTSAGPVVGLAPDWSTWQYTAATYAATTGAFGRVVTPSAPPTTYQKRFYPVCAKMLFPGLMFGGNVLITNYTGVTENLARENVGSPGTGLYGEIFEVASDHDLQDRRIIPDPFSRDWNDPLNQPSYAERY